MVRQEDTYSTCIHYMYTLAQNCSDLFNFMMNKYRATKTFYQFRFISDATYYFAVVPLVGNTSVVPFVSDATGGLSNTVSASTREITAEDLGIVEEGLPVGLIAGFSVAGVILFLLLVCDTSLVIVSYTRDVSALNKLSHKTRPTRDVAGLRNTWLGPSGVQCLQTTLPACLLIYGRRLTSTTNTMVDRHIIPMHMQDYMAQEQFPCRTVNNYLRLRMARGYSH